MLGRIIKILAARRRSLWNTKPASPEKRRRRAMRELHDPFAIQSSAKDSTPVLPSRITTHQLIRVFLFVSARRFKSTGGSAPKSKFMPKTPRALGKWQRFWFLET